MSAAAPPSLSRHSSASLGMRVLEDSTNNETRAVANHSSRDFNDSPLVTDDSRPPDESGAEQRSVSGDTFLPVASPVEPPPELLKRLRELEEQQQNPNLPTAIPHDVEAEKKAARRKLWGMAAFSILVLIVGITLGVTLGQSNSSESAVPTPSPTSVEFAALQALLESVSFDGGASLQEVSSPQYQALKWLEGNANLDDYPDWKRIQRFVLAVFYHSMNGDEWFDNTGWLSDDEECTWLTLTDVEMPLCNEKGEYYSLALLENNLEGTIPIELALLSDSLCKLVLYLELIAGCDRDGSR